MALTDLYPGKLVRMEKIESLHHDGRSHVTFNPPKGKVFCVLVMGQENRELKEGEDGLDAVQVLKDMGWTPPQGV